MVFHLSLRDSKTPQVSRTLLLILVDLNNTIIWIVSIRLLIPKSPSLFSKSSGDVSSAPVTIGMTVTFMFHGINSLARSMYLFFFFFFFFHFVVHLDRKVNYTAGSFSSLIITRYGLLARIRWSVCIWKSQIFFLQLLSQDGFRFVHLLLVSKVKFHFLAQFRESPFHPVMSSLILLLSYVATFAYIIKSHLYPHLAYNYSFI